jgi:hypothetical protein
LPPIVPRFLIAVDPTLVAACPSGGAFSTSADDASVKIVVIAPIEIALAWRCSPCSSASLSRSIKIFGSTSLFLNNTRSDCPPAIGIASSPYFCRSLNASSIESGLINFLSMVNFHTPHEFASSALLTFSPNS